MKIEKLTEKECIDAIKDGKQFHAEVANGAFEIKIEKYSYFVCAAIHDGHQLRHEIVENCALNEDDRLYEEDPFTGELVSSMPVTIIARDSRYEYDLNRGPDTCVYEEAWGKPVWKTALSEEEKSLSLHKHHSFYRVLGALLEKIQTRYGNCLVYDMHSYNYKRINKDVPVFNVGTEQLDKEKWARIINHWVKGLNTLSVPGVDVRAAADEVFYGRGYLATFVAENFDNVLALPTEVKKVFMDELTGQVDTNILAALKSEFEKSLLENAEYFSSHHIHK
jgi:hypothetical protein